MTVLRAAVIAVAVGLLAGHWLSEQIDRGVARPLGTDALGRWWA